MSDVPSSVFGIAKGVTCVLVIIEGAHLQSLNAWDRIESDRPVREIEEKTPIRRVKESFAAENVRKSDPVTLSGDLLVFPTKPCRTRVPEVTWTGVDDEPLPHPGVAQMGSIAHST